MVYCVQKIMGFHKIETGQIYGDSRNYDLTLCTSKLGLDKAEEILLCAAKEL